MASVSYQIDFAQTSPSAGSPYSGVDAVTIGANAPAGGAGFVEIRIDQTLTAVTDGQSTTGTRALKRGEVLTMLASFLLQAIERDTSLNQ